MDAYRQDGIWFPTAGPVDGRAAAVWSEAARVNPINAAAATAVADPFAKYPTWIQPLFAGATGTVLDAGCGYGRIAVPLLTANPGLRCIGVDASTVMLNRFVALAREHQVADRVELFCGTLDALPFPDASFDAVLSCAVLLHLPKRDVRGVIAELRRVLVPGGRLVLAGSFPNAWNAEGLLDVRNNFDTAKNGPVRVYSRSEVRRLLAGFSSVDIQSNRVTLLPRKIGPFTLPIAGVARRVNDYGSSVLARPLSRSGLLVSHHNVVAAK